LLFAGRLDRRKNASLRRRFYFFIGAADSLHSGVVARYAAKPHKEAARSARSFPSGIVAGGKNHSSAWVRVGLWLNRFLPFLLGSFLASVEIPFLAHAVQVMVNPA
jgi:hypothetical protein